MAIGERIRFFRNLKGMTQKWLGIAAGFPEKTADIRLAQYEAGTRSPKKDMTERLAYYLDVSPEALTVPNIDTDYGIAHTLFALEDLKGLRICEIDGEPYLKFNAKIGERNYYLSEFLLNWSKEANKLANGEITREEYDYWRYQYPKALVEEDQRRRDALREKEKREQVFDRFDGEE